MKLKQIFSVLLVILISGCIGGGVESESPVIQGDSGVEFEIQNLPSGVRSNTDLAFTVLATNYGGYSVPIGAIQIRLANTNFFETILTEDLDQSKLTGSTNALTNAVPLSKRIPELNRGDVIFFEYDPVKFKLPGIPGDKTSLSVDTCYYYQTDGLTDICISDDSYGEICNAVGAKETFSSASSLKIVGVEQLNSLKTGPPALANIRSTIKFKIKYVGDGTINSKSNDFTCSDIDLTPNSIRLNSIKIGSQIVEDIDDSCGGSDVIYLDELGEASITCSLLTYAGWTTQLGEFNERLTFSVDYVENKIISKDLSII